MKTQKEKTTSVEYTVPVGKGACINGMCVSVVRVNRKSARLIFGENLEKAELDRLQKELDEKTAQVEMLEKAYRKLHKKKRKLQKKLDKNKKEKNSSKKKK